MYMFLNNVKNKTKFAWDTMECDPCKIIDVIRDFAKSVLKQGD